MVVLGLAYAASFLFVSATVSIFPKQTSVPINVSGQASMNPTDESLAFTIVTLSREASKEIPATGEEKVQKKASGKIVIYNNFSADAQKLIANTRFETSDGLIFRIQDAVNVPGQKSAGGVVTPGSLTVTVFADQAGEKYNIGLSDFTIPGFKGDPRFTKITAKSDPSSPISGGFIGTVAKVSPNDAVTAKASIETQLKGELRDGLRAQIPDSHILFTNAYTFNFEELPMENKSGTGSALTATTKEKGTIYGILFDRNAVSKYLAERSADIGQKDVSVSNLESINFTLENTAAFSPATSKNISFKLAGNADFVWNIDEMAVSESLTGQKRSNIKGILASFEAIDKASVAISPVWIFTLPDDPSKIEVELKENQ